MAEPTGNLTFSDLILAVSEKMGTSYYGADGTAAPAIPTNAQDLAVCKRIVNNAIRRFINDGPRPNGWRWLRPVASVDLWADIAVNASNKISTATYDGTAGKTTFVVPTAAFYASMELRTITVTGLGDFTITDYVSATSVKVSGDAHTAANKTWSMATAGAYTLPQFFSGQFLPGLTFSAGTNMGVGLQWTDETDIREWRSNVTLSTGIPYLFAVRIMDSGTPRRRWELLTYPTPSSLFTVQFPYTLYFDQLVATTDVPPAPFAHDEAVRAVCLAQVENEIDHQLGVAEQYYQQSALPGSHRADAMSAPKTLGYFWNGGQPSGSVRTFRNSIYRRPTVTVNT